MSYRYHKQVTKIETPRRGDVYLAHVPGKNRPIVVLDIKGCNVKYLICTTQMHDYYSEYEIIDRAEAGLNAKTFVARSSIKSMNISGLIHKLGHLSARDRSGINTNVCRKAEVSNGNYDETWQNIVLNRLSV